MRHTCTHMHTHTHSSRVPARIASSPTVRWASGPGFGGHPQRVGRVSQVSALRDQEVLPGVLPTLRDGGTERTPPETTLGTKNIRSMLTSG